MLTQWSQLIDQILAHQEKVFSNQNYGEWQHCGGTYPRINLEQEGDDLFIYSELPGVQKKNLRLEIKDNQLRLSGKRSLAFGKEEKLLHRERGGQEFDRTFRLPFRVDSEKIQASLKDGILEIQLTQSPEDKAQNITIH